MNSKMDLPVSNLGGGLLGKNTFLLTLGGGVSK